MDTKNEICRLCLSASGTLSLSDKDGEVQYSVQIMRWTSIVISEEDDLPRRICLDCAALLHTASDFLTQCEASDRRLRSGPPPETVKSEVKQECEVYKGEEIKCDNDIPSSHHDDSYELKGKRKKKEYRCKRLKKGPIQCTMCGLLVACASAMQVHLRAHTGERPYHCAHCPERFKSSGGLKRHAEARHLPRERRFTCETCGANFYRKNEIIQHLRRHTGERPYICPFCSQRFTQISSLIRHKRSHTGDKPYSCEQCGKAFPDRAAMNQHSLVHTNERKYTCHLCSKAFKTKRILQVHINTLHSNTKNNGSGIMCNICGVSFSVKGNLTVHMMRKHSEKSGECTVCLKSFSNLQEHMRKHTGEKPFICDLCNKAFDKKNGLANHWLFKHCNTEKYKCSLGGCSRSFPKASMLEFHLLKHHTQHTPHVCPQCARGFYRVCDLTRHLRVTHMCSRTEKEQGKLTQLKMEWAQVKSST